MALPNPKSFLPKPYNIEGGIQHAEHVRPLSQAINIALNKTSRSEGGPADPLSTDPRGNPDILKRLRLNVKAPSIKIPKPKLSALRGY